MHYIALLAACVITVEAVRPERQRDSAISAVTQNMHINTEQFAELAALAGQSGNLLGFSKPNLPTNWLHYQGWELNQCTILPCVYETYGLW